MKYGGEYLLRNERGTQVLLGAMGACIRKVITADRNGIFANISLCPVCPPDGSYAGATLAPYAGRVRSAELSVQGKPYSLSRNEGMNHLHGGFENLSNIPWHVAGVERSEGEERICFEIKAADGLDGYPGNRIFRVNYILRRNDQLDLVLSAQTDRPTRVNLSNHAYWNLSGDFTQSTNAHFLQIHADEVYFNDETHLAVNRNAVAGTAFDFRSPRPLHTLPPHPQLLIANGYNHAFILRNHPLPAAVLYDPDSGRRLQMYTDQPCVVFYAGGYLTPSGCAIALEAVAHPILPNANEASDTLLTPGKPYHRSISFVFDAPEALSIE